MVANKVQVVYFHIDEMWPTPLTTTLMMRRKQDTTNSSRLGTRSKTRWRRNRRMPQRWYKQLNILVYVLFIMMSLSSTHRRPMFYAKHEVMFCSSLDVASAKFEGGGLEYF